MNNEYQVGSAKCSDCKTKFKVEKGWKYITRTKTNPPALYCPKCSSRHGIDPARPGIHKRRGRPSK